MIKQILLFAGFIFVLANVAAAQTRTVTNADLEKFRLRRVQAEQEYRQNYQRLGLPSPEELEKQREQNRRELSDLSQRLQRENFERAQRQREDELRQAQIEYYRAGATQYYQGAYNGNAYSSGYYGSYGGYGFPGGYYNNFYNNPFGYYRGFGNGGNFYHPIAPGTPFFPGGVRINNNGLKINITGGSRPPIRGGIRR